jgi:hypothetical protein
MEFYSTSSPSTYRLGGADLRTGLHIINNFIRVTDGKGTTLFSDGEQPLTFAKQLKTC